MSRSFVGSSRIRKLGLRISTVQRYSRRRSPPLSRATKLYCVSGVKRKCCRNCDALMRRPSPKSICSAISVTTSITRFPSSNSSPCWL